MSAGIVLGAFDLVNTYGSDYTVETLAEGTELGNPPPITVAIRSLLMDGSIAVHEGDDNRDIMIRVIIKAPDSAALSAGSMALAAELYRRNTLTYTPPDGWGVPTVFDVVTSSLERSYDDLAEVRGERIWLIRLTCLPFGRSVEKVSATALPTTGTSTTSLDAGSSTTNWTASHTITSSGGAVRSTTTATSDQTDLWLTRTFGSPQSLATQRYVVVDWSCPHLVRTTNSTSALDVTLTCLVDGSAQEKVAEIVLASGFTRSWFLSTDTSASTFKFQVTAKAFNKVGTTLELAVDQLSRSDVMPSVGTGRQLMRYIDVQGSARTQGDLSLSHASSGLGQVLIYTREASGSPNTPSLRPFKTSAGATTTNSALVSGVQENDLDTAFEATVPKIAVPNSTYEMLALVKASTAGAANLRVSASVVLDSFVIKSAGEWTVPLALTTSWQIVPLGPRFQIDHLVPAEANAQVLFSIEAVDSAVTVQLDDAWPLDVGAGELTWVDLAAGSGGLDQPPLATRLWMLPPDIDTSYARLLRGTEEDMSDAFAAEPTALGGANGAHLFEPGVNSVFTVTTGAVNPVVEFDYYPRFRDEAVAVS